MDKIVKKRLKATVHMLQSAIEHSGNRAGQSAKEFFYIVQTAWVSEPSKYDAHHLHSSTFAVVYKADYRWEAQTSC